MAILFSEILYKGTSLGLMPNKTNVAREWYREKAREFGNVNETNFFKDQTNKFRSTFDIGSMYLFYYDPKLKATLPYYDRVPLVFPIGSAPGGFLGINMHYLPYDLRAKLMDSLYTIASDDKFNQRTKLQLSYKTLNSAAKFREFKPTVKHYLLSNVRSKFMYIRPSEWDMALFLNIAKFEKASQTQVWEESKRIIKGR